MLATNLTRTLYAIVAANGTASILFTPVQALAWIVRQVSIKQPAAPAGALCELQLDGAFLSPLFPNRDAAVEPPAVTLLAGHTLGPVWSICTPGAQCEATIIYDEAIG